MEEGRIGILTFHCSDNYGAMLQAYALKKYLLLEGIKAAIVPYAPPFMTGRHWWFPYVPNKGWAGCIEWAYGWKMHLSMRGDFFRQRANMKYFRRKYLTEEGKRTLYLSSQLKELAYSYYIVGSDQIWNPVITCGLRKEYFGAFGNRYKKKVIAYAASLGGVKLAAEYEEQLAELLSHVDAVSVREEEAVSYIQKFYQGEVLAVLDPVFLLEKEQWQEIEKISGYEYLILDLTDGMGGLFELLSYCFRIYTITKDDGFAMAKMNQYEQALQLNALNGIAEKTVKCRFPVFEKLPADFNLMTHGELAGYARAIIREDLYGKQAV